jgi:hypothetical protein
VVSPVIDGTNVVWTSHVTFRSQITLGTPNCTTALEPDLDGNLRRATPYFDYRANDGWVAFDKEVSGQMTAWTRAPGGTIALASPLSAVSGILGLNGSGEIVYDVRSATFVTRYLGSATAAGPTKPIPIGGSLGTMRWLGADWFELVGRDVFRVDRTGSGIPDAGAGHEDADAAPDAGTSPDASSNDGSAVIPTNPGDDRAGADNRDSSSSGGCTVSASSNRGTSLLWLLALAMWRRRSRMG